ncbi:MAG: methyltransferase domain-containing protein [Candidatus Dormiibacterota bacterium]
MTDPRVESRPTAEPDPEATQAPAGEHHDLYGQSYYETDLWRADGHGYGTGPVPYRWGEPYWEEFFRHIADEIVLRLHPQTVLDAGCAIGFLVKSLRDLDVTAVGFDSSTWAISQVLADARPFCRLGSVTDELTDDYDLITCIEVLEHVGPTDAASAVANFCRHGRAVLFSSTPEHFAEVTHINVHPPDYWAELFSRHGFYRNFDFDASFVAPHAVLFHPVAHWQQVVRGYERWNWDSQRELQGVRAHRDRLYAETQSARTELNALLNTKTFRLTARARAAWARAHAKRR